LNRPQAASTQRLQVIPATPPRTVPLMAKPMPRAPKRMVEVWPAVVDHVRQSGSEMLSTLFEGARPIAVDSERSIVRVGFPSSAKFNKRKAEAQANVERITESVKAIVGERFRPVYELVEGEDEPTEPAAGEKELAEEEIIELIKTKFDASEVIAEEEQREEGTG
jgi:hypothetical protein